MMSEQFKLTQPIKPYTSTRLVTSHCTLCRVTCTWWLLDFFERAMVGTRWAISRPDCMDRLRKYLVEGWFPARKAAWALSGCMTSDSADHCMLINEWLWSKSQVCLLRLELDMGSVWSQCLDRKGDKCVKGTYMLNVV